MVEEKVEETGLGRGHVGKYCLWDVQYFSDLCRGQRGIDRDGRKYIVREYDRIGKTSKDWKKKMFLDSRSALVRGKFCSCFLTLKDTKQYKSDLKSR